MKSLNIEVNMIVILVLNYNLGQYKMEISILDIRHTLNLDVKTGSGCDQNNLIQIQNPGQIMVFIFDGCSFQYAHTCSG